MSIHLIPAELEAAEKYSHGLQIMDLMNKKEDKEFSHFITKHTKEMQERLNKKFNSEEKISIIKKKKGLCHKKHRPFFKYIICTLLFYLQRICNFSHTLKRSFRLLNYKCIINSFFLQ